MKAIFKICTKCGVSKKTSDFGLKKGQIETRCKECRKELAHEFRIRTSRGQVKRRFKIMPRIIDGITYIQCSDCRQYKPTIQYSRDSKRPFGVCLWCKKCYSKRSKNSHKRYRTAAINSTLRRRYGITLEDRNRLLRIQNNCCALCLRNESEYGRTFHVDHIHGQYGKSSIRGLLCDMCNGRFLVFVEKYPQLQNDFVKTYLAARPLT